MISGSFKSVVAIALFAAAVAALGARQYKNLLDPADPHSGNWGMADFRDVIYYPTVAVLEGNNPYDSQEYMGKYPVGNVFPLYTPHLLLLFLPFGLLPFGPSGVLFWLCLVSTYPVFAALCLKVCEIRPLLHRVFFLATAILISNPGRWSFNAGQLTVLWSIGTLVAMQCAATRPISAGFGLMLAACKPTFGVPLALLLLLHGRYKPVLIAAGAAALVGGVVLAIIAAATGWSSVWTMLDQNQSVLEADRKFDPATSNTRVDANVFLLQVLGLPGGRWSEAAVFGTIILLAGAILRRAKTIEPATAAGALALLAITVCVYHQSYDTVLLALIPLAVFAASRAHWSDVPRLLQLTVALLSAVPLFNVTWTETFNWLLRRGLNATDGALDQFAGIAAVVNSTACLSALCLLAAVLWTQQARRKRHEAYV